MSLDEADIVLLRRVFDAGPYVVAKRDDKDLAQLDQLTVEGCLTAWPVNVRDRMFVLTNRGRKASRTV